MKQLFEENRNAFLLLLGLFFILLAAVYFLFYNPLAKELKQTESQENALQEDIQLLTSQVEALEVENQSSIEIENVKLEKKVPKLPELEEFLLTLNEIELLSNSSISEMAFGYQGELPERNQMEETIDEELTNENEEQANEETGETEESVESPLEFLEMPEGLQPVIVTLDVESPDYEHFQLLMREIEKQERLMIVTSVEFDKPAESELVLSEEPSEVITARLVISTFYFN